MQKRTNGRIVYPRSAKGILELAAKVFKKHQLDGTTSILRMLEDINVDDVGPTIEQARLLHERAEELRQLSEQAYRDRDNLLSDIEKMVRDSSQLIKIMNRSNSKRVGDWGYTVDDSIQEKKTKKPKGDTSTDQKA